MACIRLGQTCSTSSCVRMVLHNNGEASDSNPRHKYLRCPASAHADESPLPRGKPWRLVGAAGLSWHRDTREAFPTLQPPDEAGYLSNIAIDPRFRRCADARSALPPNWVSQLTCLSASSNTSHGTRHARANSPNRALRAFACLPFFCQGVAAWQCCAVRSGVHWWFR